MVKVNKILEDIHKKLIKCFPKSYVTVDIGLEHHCGEDLKIDIRAYIDSHIFKQSQTSFSNHCNSIEGFITHINFEMQDIDGWKPIKELKERLV